MNGMHHAGTQWPLSWPLVLAELLMFGLAAFCRWIAPIEPSASPALERRSIQMIRICALLYLAYAPVVFLFDISTMAATDLPSAASLAGPVLLDSHIGHVWLCRFVVLAFLLFLVWSFSVSPARLTAICLAAFALLFLRSFQTHAVDKGLTMVAVNTIHQAAAGLWFGSLMALLLGSGSANPMLEGWRSALIARVSRAAG